MRTAAGLLATILAAAPEAPSVGAEAPQRFHAPAPAVRSWQQLRFAGMERQKFDYSCGAASVLNLLRAVHGAVNTDEPRLLADYFRALPVEEQRLIQRDGLSLYDLSVMLESAGLRPIGLRFDRSSISELDGPMIVYLVVYGSRHFAVLEGIRQGRAALVDPSRGRIEIPLYKFLCEWDGTALVLDEASESREPDADDRNEDQSVLTDAARTALR